MTSNQEPSDKGQTAGNRGHLLTDISLLSTIIVELNIARKQVALYGARHSLVAESIDRLLSSLGKAHEHEQDLRIGAARKTLLYGEFALDRDNPVFRELAEALFRKRIAAVTISAGVSAPMSSPIGPWMRSTSAGRNPAASNRSLRRPAVLVLPTAPI